MSFFSNGKVKKKVRFLLDTNVYHTETKRSKCGQGRKSYDIDIEITFTSANLQETDSSQHIRNLSRGIEKRPPVLSQNKMHFNSVSRKVRSTESPKLERAIRSEGYCWAPEKLLKKKSSADITGNSYAIPKVSRPPLKTRKESNDGKDINPKSRERCLTKNTKFNRAIDRYARVA